MVLNNDSGPTSDSRGRFHDENGRYISIRDYVERIFDERQLRLDDKFEAIAEALKLQAAEYERRLADLNGEYARDRTRQANYVGVEKYETNLQQEQEKREFALLRVDEKFAEYVQRYELRQREVDLLLAAQKGATDQATRAAEDQGRKSNRNLALLGITLTAFVALANFLPSIIPG